MVVYCLPIVDNCCAFVRNLHLASILIGIYGIIRGLFALSQLIFPLCRNMARNTGLGIVEFILAALIAMVGVVLIIGSLLVITRALLEWGTTDIFVYAVFFFVPLSILYWICYTILVTLSGKCDMEEITLNLNLKHMKHNSAFRFGDKPGVHSQVFLYSHLIGSIFEGFLLFYFAIVVNSMADSETEGF